MSHSVSDILMAAHFAASKHATQRRKDRHQTPYINHCLIVADILSREGGVEDATLLMAALLHDTVEDTETSLDEVEQLFGAEVRNLVAEVTDDTSLPKQRRKEKQVETAPHKSSLAKQLKIADKIANIRDIDTETPATWDTHRKREYVEWAEQVVTGCRGVNPALDRRFDDAVREARRRLDG